MSSKVAESTKRIVIVGGGTSGWMTAALMSQVMRSSEQSITVIEPPGPRGIGVGEASVISMVQLLKKLGADEVEMMQRCEATYKLGIRFCDWYEKGHDNWHPFGVCGARIDGRDLFPFWLADSKRFGTPEPYEAYSLQWAASNAGKAPHAFHCPSPIAQTQSYAFHFNAEALAGWLREIALRNGVNEISGAVRDAEFAENGDVSAVRLFAGERVEGDLFVDCSGFQSVLMNKALGDPFESWSSYLLCDRAVAFKIPAEGSVPPYTKSHALSAGWAWHIPLASHLGLGYVYSSQFISDEAAWEELRQHAQLNPGAGQEPRFLKMRVGRQQSFWKQNVVAIGLSAGFLEPLESSGIHLSQVGIELLLKSFPSGRNVDSLRDYYNQRMASIYDEVRDFVQMHYRLSRRADSAFWIAAREAEISGDLKRRLNLYDEVGMLDNLQAEAFTETSYFHLLTGNKRLPRRAPALAASADPHMVHSILASIKAQNDQALRDLPPHEELLRRIHRIQLARAS